MGQLLVYTPDKIAGTTLCRLLKHRCLQPFHHDNSEAVIDTIRFGQAGIVILDLSSVATVTTITKDIEDILTFAEGIPVIVLTPYAKNAREMEPFRRRGYYLLEKPISLDDLIKLIGSLPENG